MREDGPRAHHCTADTVGIAQKIAQQHSAEDGSGFSFVSKADSIYAGGQVPLSYVYTALQKRKKERELERLECACTWRADAKTEIGW
jgi:hypothetical protein